MTAPIILFVFARPNHTRRVLEALASNSLAEQSNLIIYADAPRHEEEREQIEEVRVVIRAASGFKSVTIVERESNYGLARNIIEGVTEVNDRYGRAIVIEDDIVTSPHFLNFMNKALDKYVNDRRVWHVGGWNFPIDPEGLDDAFFSRLMNCWGWATWRDRWCHFRKEPSTLVASWGPKKIRRFNLDGNHDFWAQVVANMEGRMTTWAIFWYATIFENHGLCMSPTRSLVQNIGHDGSGENCGKTEKLRGDLTVSGELDFPPAVVESAVAVDRICKYFIDVRGTFLRRVMRKLKWSLVNYCHN